ncbi:hypothetical protein SLEP1_g40413 [Rubroshorea leprosula]|uniref:DUF4218 domain-containing protein n=1 Tax=Rubroshorea leprosula TaxID=152421 RepID=A0AAV5L3P7_9ROSI|nr:hypothetical protein SLEP1_g40413 [Rubroshorea leprosula]
MSSYLSMAEGIEIPRWHLLPIAFRDFLIDEVWGPLTKISSFFRALTALIIQVSNMTMWEEKIVETICNCKLEKVFPLAFFHSMEHLPIHLPYKAKVGGPVQFRWMYPFKRKGWLAASSQGGEQVVISEVMQLPYVAGEECVGEDDDEKEEFDGTETSEEEQEQPTITQRPLDDDQYPSDDATMEEDIEERNLEAELDVEFVVLDPELDAQLEEELSRAILKTECGMDKGDDAPANPSQRKLFSLNRRGTFSHERFGRIATVIWKYLNDEPVFFWSSWLEEKKRVAWENF